MRPTLHGRFSRQVDFLRQQFLQEGQGRLPFTDILSAECLTQVLEELELCWNDRIFTPLVTLWVFLGQVLSADQSCRAAVARLIAHRVSQGLKAVQLGDGGVLPGAGSACPSGSSPPWPASWGGTWTRGSTASGSGRAAASACSTARRSPCPTRRRTAGSTPWPTTRCPGRASPSRGSGPSSRCRAGRSSTWASAATPARARGRSACCGGCGTCCAPATCCWGTA